MKIAAILVVLAAGCGGQLEDVGTHEAAINGFGSASTNPFWSGVVRIQVGARICTGTLINRYYVLTDWWCVGPEAASSITVTLPNHSTGAELTSTVRWTITGMATLLFLNFPIDHGGGFPTMASVSPPNQSTVLCQGYGGGSLRNGSFTVANSQHFNFELTGNLTVENGNLGGPCFDSANNIVGLISTTSSQYRNALVESGDGSLDYTTDRVRVTTSVQGWIDDMIYLSDLRPGRYSYTFVNRINGKALDVAWGNSYPGEAVNQVQPNGQLNQNWYEEYTDYPFMRLISAKSGKCLDINSANKLIQNTCNGSASQKWRAVYHNATYFALVSATSGCIDVPSGSTQNGVRLQKYACNGGTNQQFYRQIH